MALDTDMAMAIAMARASSLLKFDNVESGRVGAGSSLRLRPWELP